MHLSVENNLNHEIIADARKRRQMTNASVKVSANNKCALVKRRQ